MSWNDDANEAYLLWRRRSFSLSHHHKGIGVCEYGAESINFGMSIHVEVRFSFQRKCFESLSGGRFTSLRRGKMTARIKILDDESLILICNRLARLLPKRSSKRKERQSRLPRIPAQEPMQVGTWVPPAAVIHCKCPHANSRRMNHPPAI